MAWLIIVLGVAVTLVVVAAFLFVRQHPESAADHPEPPPRPDATGRGVLRGDTMERPAGPDAEAQHVADRGESRPGPSPGPPG